MSRTQRHRRIFKGDMVVPSMQEILDDLCCKFTINLPEEELGMPERICFQVELAHWFYEDFYREKYTELTYYGFKPFCKLIFQHSPNLEEYHGNRLDQIISDFIAYKNSVPVGGAILLNYGRTKCLMIKGWNKKSQWGFPKGKINEDEMLMDCAIREVKEEIGFDISSGIQETEYIEYKAKNKMTRLYIILEVPEETLFSPQTKKEIGDISWHLISDIVSNKNGVYGMSSLVVSKTLDHLRGPKSNARLRRLLELIIERIPIERRRALINTRMNRIPREDTRVEYKIDTDKVLQFPKPKELMEFLQILPNRSVNKDVDREKVLDRLNRLDKSIYSYEPGVSESLQLPRSCLYKDKEKFKFTISGPFI
jgi:ADP-ribose pyrophosphatase YjhB (NUDIX family)